MPPVGLEPTIPASERPQTHALDRTATAIGKIWPLQESNAVLLCLTLVIIFKGTVTSKQYVLRIGKNKFLIILNYVCLLACHLHNV